MITILAGGTGSIKMVRGFAAHDQEVTVISNVGDNYWSYGMIINMERWGLKFHT